MTLHSCTQLLCVHVVPSSWAMPEVTVALSTAVLKPAAEAREGSLQAPPAAEDGAGSSAAAAVAAAPLKATTAPAPLQLQLVRAFAPQV